MEIKPFRTYQEQLNILKRRGIAVHSEERCLKILSVLNYYRFSAYFLPFKQPDSNYQAGTTFLRVYRIYEFDRKLRRIIFSAVEEIEIYLRTQLAYYHAQKYGPTGYLDASNFSQKHNEEKFRDLLDREITANSRALFVIHHQNQYSGVFPIWVITELFTFGMLSRFYSDLKRSDQAFLAEELYQTSAKNVRSWLRCCTDIRNICAHYGRLYYRIFSATPAGFDIAEREMTRLWGAMLVIKALFPEKEKWNGEILPAFIALFDQYETDIDLDHIAFPQDWLERLTK